MYRHSGRTTARQGNEQNMEKNMVEVVPVAREPVSGEAPTEQAPVETRPHNRKSLVREVLETVALTAILFIIARSTVQPFRVDGHSMDPTLHDQEFILVDKVSYHLGQPQRGDIVVFKPPFATQDDYVKRVIGLPGDVVSVHGGQVYVNGKVQSESYLPAANQPQYTMPAYKVPPHVLFVLGDNRNNSYNSHLWGMATPLSENLVVGKAILAYWPLPDFQIFAR